MPQDSHPDGFTEVESFSLGADAAIAADETQALLATPTGRVEIATADGESETLSLETDIKDVAIDQYVFTVADGAVTAYTTSGIELWSTPVTEPRRVASLGREGVLACVTADGRVVGIDTETGSELYTVERPHSDVTAENTVVGGYGRVVIASWSFLVAFDTAGTLMFDRNIEGAIEDVAVLATGIVVRLKNGQLLRLDGETADKQWSQATDARAITAYGDGAILSVDADGVSAVDEHGTERPLSLPRADTVLATGDQRLVVTTADQSQTVYRSGQPSEASLTAAAATDTVDSGERIRFRVTNDGDDPVDGAATLRIDPVDALRVRRTTADLELPGGASTDLEFHVTDAVEPGDVDIELAVDGEEVGSGTVTVEQRRDLPDAVDVSTALESVDADGATVSVTARNVTGRPLRVGLASGDRMDSLDPERAATFETTVGRDRTDTLSLSVAGDGETVAVPVEVPAGGTPSLTIEAAGSQSNPYLDVVVGNDTGATLSGSMSVRLSASDRRLERSLSLDAGATLRLAVMLTAELAADGLDATATLDGFDASTTATLRPVDWADSEGDVAAPPDRATGLTTTDERPVEDGADELPTEGGTDRPTPAPTLDIVRTTPDSVRRGERFTERVELTNTGTAVAAEVTLDIGDVTYPVGRVAPEETVALDRSHAVFEQGTVSLPAGRVTIGGAEAVDVPARTVRVEPSAIEATAVATTRGDATTFEYVWYNRTEEPCRLLALGANAPGMSSAGWQLDGATIEGGDTATFERTVEHDGEPPTGPLRAGCQYTFTDGDRETYWTLTRPPADDGESAPNDSGLSVDVEALSVPLAGRNSTIECSLTAGDSLSDVTVEATGDIVSPLSTGERDLGDVPAGETVSQAIDVLPDDAGTATFDLRITAATDEGRYQVGGPVAAAESDSVTDTWTARSATAEAAPAADSDEETASTAPTHLVTTFRS